MEDEEAIFEDREAGSLPTIRLPHIPQQATWLRAVPLPTPKPKSSKMMAVSPSSAEPIIFSALDPESESKGPVAIILLPGMTSPTIKALPRKPGQNHHTRHRNTSNYNKQRKGVGPKSRESSGSYSTSQSSSKEQSSGANGTVSKSRSEYRRGGWAKVSGGRTH